MSDNKKYVLITGASSGIGRASCNMLAENGYTVFAGVRKQSDADKLASDKIIPVFIDVNDHDSVDKAYIEVAEKTEEQGLTALVNNAGVAVAGPLEALPIDKLRFQLETNVIGQVKVTQAFLPLIRKGTGRIVNISSIAGLVASPFLGAYCSSKFAMEALSDSLRRELSPWGIKVALIEPGIIKTNIWEKSANSFEESISDMREEAKHHYLPFYKPLMEKTQEKVAKVAIPAEKVAEAVLDAVTSKRPKLRYTVGNDAKMVRIIKHLPGRLLDRFICNKKGICTSACNCE